MEKDKKAVPGVTVVMWHLENKKFITWVCCCHDCAKKFIAQDKPELFFVLDIVDNLPFRKHYD